MTNFHEGEISMQTQFGMAESMARVGEVALRSFMPEQHRDFFSILPYLLVGSVAENLQPSASVLMGSPGFVQSPTSELLVVRALPSVADSLHQNLQINSPLGLLGLQAHTKRRNRMNGIVVEKNSDQFSVAVQQSFGNCPKYIVPREVQFAPNLTPTFVEISGELSEQQISWIANADTFFIATAHPDAMNPQASSHGVDVSHRGGNAGFISVDKNRLSFPDFRGNYFFNSFGNLRLNPKAGLIFLDFVQGNVLQLEVQVDFRTSTEAEKNSGVQMWVDCEIMNVSCSFHSLNLKQL